jgi:hypothetical protein
VLLQQLTKDLLTQYRAEFAGKRFSGAVPLCPSLSIHHLLTMHKAPCAT